MGTNGRLARKAQTIENDIMRCEDFGVYMIPESLKAKLGVDRISEAVKRLLEDEEDGTIVADVIADSARRFNRRDWGDEAANRHLLAYSFDEPSDWQRSDDCPGGIGADGWYATPFGTLCIHRDSPGAVVAFLRFER